MASVITYNQVIELLIDITKRHEQVNTFFLGRNWETENSEDILFPLFQVYPDFGKLTANSYNEYKTQTIRFVCKMLDLTTNGEENKRDVHSDTLRYAQDIVNEFNQHPFYMRSNIKLIGDVDFNEVLQEYQDDVTAGWEFNLTFQLININQFCGMPIQDIPGYAATGPESTGTIVNVQYLTCATLPDCPTIITIDETLIDLQEQIDNLPPSALTLAQVLGFGNSTGNQIITAGTNLSNILQVSDTVVSLEWSDTSFGSVILNNSFIKLAHDTFVTIDTVQTLILGEFHHILTGVDTITRIDTVPDSILLSVDRTLDGYDNQVYVERYLTGVSASNVSGAISKLEIHTIPEPLLTGDPSLSNAMIITDNICNKGLVYVADYSANFTDNSLVTKAWVLAQTPAAPSLQTVISVSSVINGFLAQSLDNGTYITLSNSGIDMSSYDGTTTSGFNMYAATGNNLYSDVSNTFNAPLHIFNNDIQLSSATINTLTYFDGSKNLKSVTLGSGLTLTASTLSVINKFSYTDASNGITSVSNSNTLSKSVLIPANTLTNGALNIKGRSQKSGTASFAWLVIYVNKTNSLSGASEIGRINNGGNNTVLNFSIDRTIPIKVGSFTAFIINAITGYEETITNNVSTVTIDWTVDQYIILAVQANGGALPSESLVANFLSVNQI